jgi:hypothetical protein
VSANEQLQRLTPTNTGADSTNSSTSTTGLPLFASVLAIVLLVIYFVFAGLQWADINAAQLTYARRADLLGGFEALAFAAAGAILGTTVQRQVTKKAEAEAGAARGEAAGQKARADAEQQDAEKGRALHNLAKAKAETTTQVRTRGGEPPTATDFDEFLNLAAQYDASPPLTP